MICVDLVRVAFADSTPLPLLPLVKVLFRAEPLSLSMRSPAASLTGAEQPHQSPRAQQCVWVGRC